eukprot:11560192-Ditylum_brightwellii.AAC.1
MHMVPLPFAVCLVHYKVIKGKGETGGGGGEYGEWWNITRRMTEFAIVDEWWGEKRKEGIEGRNTAFGVGYI